MKCNYSFYFKLPTYAFYCFFKKVYSNIHTINYYKLLSSTYVNVFFIFILNLCLKISWKIIQLHSSSTLKNCLTPDRTDSHSIAVESPFQMCFISGQSGGLGEHHLLATDFQTQVQHALENVKIILQNHSMTFDHIVKITLLIVDHNQEKLRIWAEEASKVWSSASLPTSTLIPVSQLALPDMLFEIDAIAVKVK